MKKNFILIAIASVVLASCSSDVAVVDSLSQEKVALGVNVNVVGAQTKAIINGDKFIEYTKPIGLILGKNDFYTELFTTYTQAAENAEWKSSNSIMLSNAEASIYGFYPAENLVEGDVDALNKTLKKVKVNSTSDFTGSAQNDYMFAQAKGTDGIYSVIKANNSDKKKITIWFQHALSKLRFKLNKGDNYVGTCYVSQVKLENTGGADKKGILLAGNEGTLNLESGVIDGLVPTTSIVLTSPIALVSKQAKTIEGGGANLDFGKVALVEGNNHTPFFIESLVAPITLPAALGGTTADLDNSLKLTLTIQNENAQVKEMSIFLPNDLAAWERGKNYEYTITIGATKLEVTSIVNVVGWDDKAGSNEDLIIN